MNLDELFDNVHKVPKIPKVVQDLIKCFESDDGSLDEIAQKVAMDQMIAARVLRLANTAKFGGARQIASVDDAVVRLGFDAVRTLVIASGLSGAVGEIAGLDIRQYWTETFQVATLCKDYARQAGLQPETAFTCAMLHNVGHVILVQYQADTGLSDADLPSTADIGAELAKRWQFPDVMVTAITQQATPLAYDEVNAYACLIAFSKLLMSVDASNDDAVNDACTSELGQQLKIDPVKVNNNLLDLKAAGEEFALSIA